VADTTSTAILASYGDYFTYVVAMDYNGVVVVGLPFVSATEYRFDVVSILGIHYHRGTELGINDGYYEKTDKTTQQYKDFTYSPSNTKAFMGDLNTIQSGMITDNAGKYRTYYITSPSLFTLKQLIIGSTDGGPNNSAYGMYDEKITVYYKDNLGAWVLHSKIIWETLPDENGNTKATSGGYFPWATDEWKIAGQSDTYPLIGRHGKQLIRWNGKKWYHYDAYGYDNNNIYAPNGKIWNGETVY
jgi:hypothetical protein